VSEDKVEEFPQLYQSLQKGRELNLKTFLIWVWKSIYQGAIIMLLCFWLFENSFTEIVTITFTALILSELLNINTALTRMNKIVLTSQILTLIVYFASIYFLRDIIDVSVIDAAFLKNVAIIVLVSWGPLQLLKVLRKRLDPTEN
jgi:phospholipid-translocating ATPase